MAIGGASKGDSHKSAQRDIWSGDIQGMAFVAEFLLFNRVSAHHVP
jgi:hypothetical protein